MAKINIKTLQGNILRIEVNEYAIKGGMVCFTDPKTSEKKQFPVSSCEITEEGEWE